jgi:excisionase family DNA binding protein
VNAAIAQEIPGLRDEPLTPAREVLCVDEVAVWFCVDRKTVYNAVARCEIPHQRLGKRILFSRAALVSWLAREGGARRKEAQDERTTG